MHDWPSILLLITQAALTIVTVEQLRRRVFVALHEFHQPELTIDVWAPITIILPMMFLVGRIDHSVHGVGWIVVGAPVICALLGLGAALLVAGSPHRSRLNRFELGPRAIIIWSGAGLVLLLLGAAHDLTMWMGQCAFAAAAMLLWINTPDEPIPHDPPSAAQSSAGAGLTIALLCALGQGIAAFFIDQKWAGISGGLMIGGAAVAVASAARFAGPSFAIRLGGWAATYGVLLALGLLSLIHLLPHAWRVQFHKERGAPVRRIAYGFGEYWIEACVLLVFGGASFILMRQLPAARRFFAALLIVAAAVLAAWRLDRI